MPDLLDHQLLFVTGKGGVGKTTVAAAIALRAASQGRRVLIAESAAQRLPRMFGATPGKPGEEVRLADGVWALTVDTPIALEEWVAHLLRSRSLVSVLTRSNVFRSFVEAAPGARELITIAKAWEVVQERRWVRERESFDLVVLDAPASGHGLGMLRTPRTFADIARVGPLHSQALRVREWLEDPELTAYLAVALPAEMPVSETIELEDRLRETIGRDLSAIVVNAVAPDRFDSAELDALGGLDGSPAGVAARAAVARAAGQAEQVERLREGADAPVSTLPFVFSEALAATDFHGLADALQPA